MVIAADYPFLDIVFTMIIFFAWVVWIWMMILILSDVFRRRDNGMVERRAISQTEFETIKAKALA